MNRPQLYSKYSELQRTDNIFVLENYLKISEWKDGEMVMDLGCGDGNFTIEFLIPKLPKNFQKLVACDISEKMLEFAREKYFLSKVEFIQLDIESGNIPQHFQNKFDHIYSFYTMHWVKRQRKAFENIFKMLAPGGDIFFTFLAKSDLYDIYLNMSEYKKWKQYSVKEFISPYHNLKYPEEHLEKLLKDIGFEIKVCKLVTRSFVFPNLETFRNTIMAINPILQKLPPEEIDDYNEDFLTEVKNMKNVIIENINNNSEKSIRDLHEIFVLIAKKPEKNIV